VCIVLNVCRVHLAAGQHFVRVIVAVTLSNHLHHRVALEYLLQRAQQIHRKIALISLYLFASTYKITKSQTHTRYQLEQIRAQIRRKLRVFPHYVLALASPPCLVRDHSFEIHSSLLLLRLALLFLWLAAPLFLWLAAGSNSLLLCKGNNAKQTHNRDKNPATNDTEKQKPTFAIHRETKTNLCQTPRNKNQPLPADRVLTLLALVGRARFRDFRDDIQCETDKVKRIKKRHTKRLIQQHSASVG
jgi:hypothetical protein